MHEAVLARAIINALNKECKKNGIKRLKTVKIEIGEMRNVVPEYLKTAYSFGVKNTGLKNSRLNIKIMSVVMSCSSCGTLVKKAAKCRKCGVSQIEIVSGLQLKIASISGDKK